MGVAGAVFAPGITFWAQVTTVMSFEAAPKVDAAPGRIPHCRYGAALQWRPARFPGAGLARSRATGAHELHFAYRGGSPVISVHGGPYDGALFDGGNARPLHPTRLQIIAVAAAAMESQPTSIQTLTRYDLYWYGTGDLRSGARPLPILRLVFDDPARTSLRIDPATGELLGQSTTNTCTYRWLLGALHSFDLPWLLEWRPLRDGLMWLFSAAGLFISVSGIVIGWRAQNSRHLRRQSRSQP